MKHKHLKLEPCKRSCKEKHCFHVFERRNPKFVQQVISMTCCHCEYTVIAQPTVFTITKRES